MRSTQAEAGEQTEADLIKCFIGAASGYASGAVVSYSVAGQVLGHPCIKTAKAIADAVFAQNHSARSADTAQIIQNSFARYRATRAAAHGPSYKWTSTPSPRPAPDHARDAGGPAARANLALGDRIVDVDGTPVVDGSAFLLKRESILPGDVIQLGVVRSGVRYQAQVATLAYDARVSARLLAP